MKLVSKLVQPQNLTQIVSCSEKESWRTSIHLFFGLKFAFGDQNIFCFFSDPRKGLGQKRVIATESNNHIQLLQKQNRKKDKSWLCSIESNSKGQNRIIYLTIKSRGDQRVTICVQKNKRDKKSARNKTCNLNS